MSAARRPRHTRVRVERLLGRPSGARLVVDHLTFDLSQADLVALAEQLLRLFGAPSLAPIEPFRITED